MTSIIELSDIDHVKLRPDMYLGEVINKKKEIPTYDITNNQIYREQLIINTGLLKIFDEILMNAIDCLNRNGTENIKISVSDKFISIENDIESIPIIKQKSLNGKEYWLPEIIFTHLRSGGNFTDNDRITGGKNGIGCKLTTIFSSLFIIEIVNDKTYYYQEIYNGCETIEEPIIEYKDTINSVKITFHPNFELLSNWSKMKINIIDNPLKRVLYKRAHDLIHLPINIFINDIKLVRSTWFEFTTMYKMTNQVFTHIIPRWKVGIGVTLDKARQVSFVNNINTYNGGTHVKYIKNQVINYILEKYPQLNKRSVGSKLVIFVHAYISSPSFDSQSKDELTTEISSFGSTCNLPPSLLSSFLETSGIKDILFPKPIEKVKRIVKKKSKMLAIDKLVEANNLGVNSVLMICEGNSAMAFCNNGIGIIGHDRFGCYALRGKVLNTNNASDKTYENNKELTELKQIIGLEDGKEYNNVSDLRYGSILCVTDADTDGNAIKGLVINFFATCFPSLLQIEGFFKELVTPVVKITKSNLYFFNIPEYKQWSMNNGNHSAEYIKGLGTNTNEDVVKIFSNFKQYNITFEFNLPDDLYLLDMCYNRSRSNERKRWITTVNSESYLPRFSGKSLPFERFANIDLAVFSNDACERSIPSIIDGLKPTQRKILYALFNSSNSKPMKVFQLTGMIAKKAYYHHGDASMNETIIKMNQDFAGSNNIPYLLKHGQFGSRFQLGNDAAQPRYISSSINPITRIIFPKEDDQLLEYRIEDNVKVEPKFYVPMIPTILLNGIRGIGTGWSTYIPSFNMKDLITYSLNKLNNIDRDNNIKLLPYINNWKGTVVEYETSWVFKGVIRKISQTTVEVIELPINYAISDFINRLKFLSLDDPDEIEKMKKSSKKVCYKPYERIITFTNNSKHSDDVNFTIIFERDLYEEQIMKALNLKESISKKNLVAYNSINRIQLYENIYDMIDEWFDVRLEYCIYRLEKQINDEKYTLEKLSEQYRFVMYIIEKKIKIFKKNITEINRILSENDFKLFDNSYKYLLKMPISSFSNETLNELQQQINNHNEILNNLLTKTPESIFEESLKSLK
jgi:DNA topoisomerase-2